MTNDELAADFESNIAELHVKIDAMEAGPQKRRAQRLASILHRAAEELADIGATGGMFQTFSGGEEKPPEGP